MPNGTVKWFNNSKGYGFIVEDGETEDLFAHFSAIEMEGYKTLKAGQKVSFEKQPNGKGIHAINISPLDVKPTNEDNITSIDSTLSSVSQEITQGTTEAANDIAVSA